MPGSYAGIGYFIVEILVKLRPLNGRCLTVAFYELVFGDRLSSGWAACGMGVSPGVRFGEAGMFLVLSRR